MNTRIFASHRHDLAQTEKLYTDATNQLAQLKPAAVYRWGSAGTLSGAVQELVEAIVFWDYVERLPRFGPDEAPNEPEGAVTTAGDGDVAAASGTVEADPSIKVEEGVDTQVKVEEGAEVDQDSGSEIKKEVEGAKEAETEGDDEGYNPPTHADLLKLIPHSEHILPLTDYILGLMDATGEIMKHGISSSSSTSSTSSINPTTTSISSTSSTVNHTPYALATITRLHIHLASLDPYMKASKQGGGGKTWSMKLSTLESSVSKLEKAVYERAVQEGDKDGLDREQERKEEVQIEAERRRLKRELPTELEEEKIVRERERREMVAMMNLLR